MQIAHVVASLAVRHGGPSRSVRNLAMAQAAEGHHVDLLTLCESASVEEQGNLTVRTFPRGVPEVISPSSAMRRHLLSHPYEAVHAHGIWLRPLHYTLSSTRRFNVPLIVSPRGMMAPWAWRHHRTRKAIAAALVHPRAFRSTTGWHVTSESEAKDVRDLGFHQPQCLAPNGVDIPTAEKIDQSRTYWLPRIEAPAGTRVALFYSRLHSKKRVIELIDLWNELAPPDWLLLLVGIPDEYKVDQLRAYATRSIGAHRVQVEDGTVCPPPYGVADLLLLPTHSENFGLVIAESLAHGVPCIVTDGAPWQELNEKGAGWWVSWERFPACLRRALAASPVELRKRGDLGPAWMNEAYSWEKAAKQLTGFYHQLHGAS